METLKRIRPNEDVVEYEKIVNDKNSVAYLLDEVKDISNFILIVKHHSDEVVDVALDQIDPEKSGNIFFYSEVELDPVNNCMVPKHRLATKSEIDFMQSRNIDIKTIPVISMMDPIRRWYNFRKRSIVAIERGTDNVYFRRVT